MVDSSLSVVVVLQDVSQSLYNWTQHGLSSTIELSSELLFFRHHSERRFSSFFFVAFYFK